MEQVLGWLKLDDFLNTTKLSIFSNTCVYGMYIFTQVDVSMYTHCSVLLIANE